MTKYVAIIFTAIALMGCAKDGYRSSNRSGVSDGSPERAIMNHGQHIVRNEAAASSAASEAARQIGAR